MLSRLWESSDWAFTMGPELLFEILAYYRLTWLGGRDSNPDTQIQSLQSYR